jgi:glycosyltransferase involved in cell wall biosynthesis
MMSERAEALEKARNLTETSKVTVLTTVHNGAAFLSETISSIQAQDFNDWEYIIVDDGSTDETRQVVENAMGLDRRIRLLIRKEPSGCYAAANAGLQESRGKYIFRIDADDLSPPNRFTRQLQYLAEHPQYRACVSFWRPFDAKGFTAVTAVKIPERPGVFKWFLLLRNSCLHSSVCIERVALQELGGYRELPLSQDYRLWAELTQRDWLGIVPEVLSYVRMHEKRQTRQRTKLQSELAMDVLSDHLCALTKQRWTRDDLDMLKAVAYGRAVPVPQGMAMFDQWDTMWRTDPQLDRKDREDLAGISREHRRRLLQANARRQPVRVLLNYTKLWFTNFRSTRLPRIAE